MVSEQIGRYQILDLLGRGSMGTVYRARDPDLGREVVVKLVSLSDPTGSQEWRQRFKREVQAAGRLNHPHIVTVYDVSLDHSPPYVVMELLTGGTLGERLKRGPLPWSNALVLFQPLVHALACAHQAGVIHRDIKPSNIMFAGDTLPPSLQSGTQEVLKLVDFGLARHEDDSLQLTQDGAVFGTPAYLSPEQARGDVVDARTDIFSMGIVLFEAITGRNPIHKGALFATLAETTAPTPIDLSPLADTAPTEVVRLIERAVTKDRQRRYATAELFLADLTRCLGNAPSSEPARTGRRLPSVPEFDTRFLTRAPSEGPTIRRARYIQFIPEVEAVLRVMFNEYSRLAIETEFGQGLSGGRVFRVRPIDAGGKAHLPAVVKIAPINLIRQEWQAYQTWVVNTLPGVARLESAPTLPPGSQWDGLRYTLVGGGAFEVQTLSGYYHQASAEDLRWVLGERLYQMIGVHWWLERYVDRVFQMQADYDHVMPVNLLLEPITLSPTANAYLITPEHLPLSSLVQGDIVHLAGFIVSEINPEQRQVTLNLPSTPQDRSTASYRLRLVDIPNTDRYQVGQIIDSLTGLVTATRYDLLATAAGQALGPTVDLSAQVLTPPPAQNTPVPASLPNPLQVYQDVLHDFLTVHISTIHGDLNLENILVDPDTRHLNLIDFATVRQGHVLHDLLRLETEVLTKLIPPTLAEAGLSPTTIYAIYHRLHLATHRPIYDAAFEGLPPTLEKAFAMLAAIRKMARTCLFNPEDWTEYYEGLILYLLGSLKFKSLDQNPTAPLPKQVAFWGAAAVVELLHKPATELALTKPKIRIRLSLLIVAIVEALIILALALFIVFWTAGS